MYTEYVVVKSKAKTAKGINAALKRDTGFDDWVEDGEHLKRMIREGFIELKNGKIIVYEDR